MLLHLPQIKSEKVQWEKIHEACSNSLSAMGIDRQTFIWALTCVRSRSFAGPHFRSTFKLKLGLFAALQALVASQALMHAVGAVPSSQGFDTFYIILFLAEILTVAIPTAWESSDFKFAQSAVQYVICPFIDFLNHSSQSKVGQLYSSAP